VNQVQNDTNMCRVIMNAMIQWFVDMGISSRIHIIADARMFDVGLLEPQVNGLYQIRLNIAAQATRNFRYNEDNFSFMCGFNGADVSLEVPYEAVLAFVVPTCDQHESILQIPNYERELYAIQQVQDLHKMLNESGVVWPGSAQDTMPPTFSAAKPIEAAPYAVHGIELQTHDEEGNKLPTNVELMRRPTIAQRAEKPAAKEQAAPLLNFGNVSGTALPAPKTRRSLPAGWQVHQGGKA
jgi:hypothetical protein